MWYNSGMGKIDKQKELIGYLKVVFSILVAVDISLVAWVFKHAGDTTVYYLYASAVIVVVITFAIIWINRYILKKIDELEDM